jgi:hypothetical protein
MNRRCTVLGTDASGSLVLQTADFGIGTAPVPRPMVGSSTTGLHSCPPVGAQVLVLHDGEHMTPVPASAVTASDALGTPAALAPSETAIYGGDGSILCWAKAGTTPKVLYQSPDGSFSVTVDPVNKRLSVTGGTLWVGGTQVSVP